MILNNQPMMGTIFFSLSLSVKAGVMLMLPAFLGQMQYNFGTVNLVKSIVLLVSFQVIIALPFLLGETSVSEYLFRSKFTGQGRKGVDGALEKWDYLAADIDNSVLFTWVDVECYYNRECFADKLFPIVLFINVYHFFIRK